MRSEVRAAQRKLRVVVAGNVELERLVDAAATALQAGRFVVPIAVEPHRLLDVRPGATDEAVRAAYRRLAMRVHPDQGGTDELFRILGAAHHALVTPAAAASGAGFAWPGPGPAPSWWAHREPPRPPPPPGPWKPPAPDARPPPPGWRAWASLAGNAAVFGAALVLAVAMAMLGAGGVVLVAVACVPAWFVLRGFADSLVRSAIVLWGARLRVPDSANPESFLEATCLDTPVGRESEELLYAQYMRWCLQRGSSPVPRWVFVERLRAVGLLFVKASAWQSGTWVGIRLR
jgi:hypothetical protein